MSAPLTTARLSPTPDAVVRAFAAWLAQNYDEIQREHLPELVEEYLRTRAVA